LNSIILEDAVKPSQAFAQCGLVQVAHSNAPDEHRPHILYALKESSLNVLSSMDTDYLTTSEIARRLRVDISTVHRWIRLGLLDAEAIKQGKSVRYRIKKSNLEAIERSDQERDRIPQ
jgi:excisionase family DNA binding protein